MKEGKSLGSQVTLLWEMNGNQWVLVRFSGKEFPQSFETQKKPKALTEKDGTTWLHAQLQFVFGALYMSSI